ncbi:hypothetical protein PISMIDRAFT_542365 [Pisolithus microcarpus 441]|uniref:Uncharacterized protein n=1 Tax=Pisolithus microcarpus 441 TaxID=765257 RepID=A0A0C9Z5A1_9AGAM|nr:hypothetical protein PISMIDRAFT_542365 [Pisolithus microcarpus 441]
MFPAARSSGHILCCGTTFTSSAALTLVHRSMLRVSCNVRDSGTVVHDKGISLVLRGAEAFYRIRAREKIHDIEFGSRRQIGC